ncbi:hypothetical protein CCHL11_01491 [Colletotrichum chlorophyti]|uniref:XRCC4 coiled-coil domain-containing protein n=1 Tax=Colletotrichum chlorophyti TaxID=708187 RepID=A0A1Q8RYE7_9PEZI|nr:hypothetical protein CCHL11_01491 [Colletotrichum chlorophyti]
MASGHVLRFPRSDSEGAFVVIQTTPSRSKGSKALDVKLVGTDGVEPYAVSLRHDKVTSLRVKNSPCTDEEWVSILANVVQQEPADEIEVLASVEDEAALTLTVRKRGKEFTQRLGSIELNHSPREVIELFEWCGLSVQTANEAKEALVSATTKATKLEESVRELKAQLDELVAAKEADESELLEKFRDLLNEKKLKIRQQQRLLASASVDPGKLAQVPSSQTQVKGHAAGKSRPSKRKNPSVLANEEGSSDDGFEKMDVDFAMEPAPEDSDQQQDTTDAEDETASEDDEDPVATEAGLHPALDEPAKPSVQGKQARKSEPPAKRDLPFGRQKAPIAKPPPPPAGSETESDDEL